MRASQSLGSEAVEFWETPGIGQATRTMIVRFRTWTFDSSRRQVVDDDGRVVHLTPKAFDLLAMLLERAPDVVRKTELHEQIWPGTFVSDATLVGRDQGTAASVWRWRQIGAPHQDVVWHRLCVWRRHRESGRSPLRPPASIAVLPFVNIGEDADERVLQRRPGGRVDHRARAATGAARGRASVGVSLS